jgi:hypothetical protein
MNKKFKTGFWILPLVLAMSASFAFAKKPQYTNIDVPGVVPLSVEIEQCLTPL